MGDAHQVAWVRGLIDALPLQGPVLEIGSRRVEGNPAFFDYRTLFPASTAYVGVDLEPGPGVDYVGDVTWPSASLLLGRFRTALCLSTLEHAREPWALARAMVELLAPGGVVVVSAPFAWIYHEYPDDYWRFSPSGLRLLFPGVVFDDARSQLSTCSGRTIQLDHPGALDYLRFSGIVVGTMASDTLTTGCYLLQPASFVSEGVNVNLVGRVAARA